MKHIGIFSTSGDVQTALNEKTLVNPYVSLVSGALDYNTFEPTPPIYVQDSSGNKYFPTKVNPGNPVIFNFNFTMDVLDTWTLYDGGSIAVGALDGQVKQYCNGEFIETQADLSNKTPQQLKDFNFGGVGYSNPDGTVIISYQKNQQEDYNFMTFEMRFTSCGGGSTSSY